MTKYEKQKYVKKDMMPKRIGRPQLEICKEDIRKLAQVGLTDQEICFLLDISNSTLNRFRPILHLGRAELCKSIKRTQLEIALQERDSKMLIWVGKQYANQSEKQQTELSGEVTQPTVVMYGKTKKK